jgi:hypothetical protein
LNEEGYHDFGSKRENMVKILKRILGMSINENKEIFKELYEVLKPSRIATQTKDSVVLQHGKKREKMPQMLVNPGASADELETAGRENGDDDDDDGDDGDDAEDNGEVVNQLAESLPTIIALLALFSVNTKHNDVCDSIDKCLTKSVDNILDVTSRCTCVNIMDDIDSVDILECFFNSGKFTEGEIRQDVIVSNDEGDDDYDDTREQDGGAGKPRKQTKIQKQIREIKRLKTEVAHGKKPQSELDNANAKLVEMKINERRKYTPQQLKKIMEIILKFMRNPRNEVLISNLNNIFDTIREAVDTMPKSKHGKNDGKHGLIYGMDISGIEQKILEHLSVRKEEKDKFGEVFTPMELIHEMFDKLPKEIWEDPTKKWLDPANGIGNFPMVAYILLMEGLENKIPDNEKRSKHIIENMLYMVEINPKNVKISRRIFGSNANICCADFLNEQDKVMKYFNERRKVEMFDVIIGNPPFQDEIEADNSRAFHGPRKGGKNKLYERITVSCIGLLNPNGYLIFVTPDNIMTGNTNKAYEELIKHHTMYVCFNNIQKRYFPTVGQSMCYFLIQKSASADASTRKETKIESDADIFSVELKERPLNPIKEWTKETEQLVNRYITDNKNNTVYNRGTSASQYKSSGKYSVIYTPTGPLLKTDNVELANGIGIKKVVLFESKPLSDGKLDATGEYGVGPHTFYVPFNTVKEGKVLDTFFKSDIYKKLVKISTTSQYLKTSLITHLNLSNITASTKIQSVVRGHKHRQTARNIRKDKTEKKELNDKQGSGGGRSRRRSYAHKHKHKHTRKKSIFGFF